MLALALLLAAIPMIPVPDEVVFKNGEKVVGTITQVVDGKITITSENLGTVTAPLDKVSTFSTDHDIDIVFADGTTVNQKVKAGPEGTILIEKQGVLVAQSLPIADIKKVNVPPARWTGSIAVGLNFSRGNSDTNNANIEINAQRRTDNDRITFKGLYASTRTRNVTTGEWETSQDMGGGKLQYDYFFTKDFYGYGFGLAEKNRIAFLQLRFIAGAGVGEQIFDTGDLSLSFEEGLTYTSETFTNATPSNEFLGGSLAYHVKGKLMEGLTAFSDATYNQSLEKLQDSLIQGQIGIRASLTKAMFAEAKYELSYNNSPAIGAERLDVRYILAIGWSF